VEFDLLNLVFVLLAAWISGAVVSRLGYPAILGELLAGIIVGPPLLGWLQGSDALKLLSEIGIFLLMLYIGMEINFRDLKRASWGGLLAAVGGFVAPFAYFLVMMMHGNMKAALFMAIAMGVTSLATKSRILVDLRLLGTRIAHVLLAGALLSDTAALIIFAAIIQLAGQNSIDFLHVAVTAGKAILFFGVAIFIGLKLLPFLGQRMSKAGFTQRTTNFSMVLLVGLLFSEMAETAGLHSILGAFMAGMFLREGVLERKLSHEVSTLVHDLSIGFLAPIFFVTAGFEISLTVFKTDLSLLILVILVASVAKIIGTALFYIPSGNGWREGLTIGAGMNGRGAVEIIIAQIGLEMGFISQEIFSILVFMAFFTTLGVPFLLKWGTAWLRRRGELAQSEDDRIGVLIVGAGPLGRKLAHLLGESQSVWLVDTNKEHCQAADAEGLNFVNGNALDEEILAQANANQARMMITMTSNPQVNLFAARLGREVYWIPIIYTLLYPKDRPTFSKILEDLGINTFDLGHSELPDWERWIVHRRAVNDELIIPGDISTEELIGKQRDRDFLPLTVSRNTGDHFFPFVESLKAGDAVRGLSLVEEEQRVQEDEFDRLVRGALILDIPHPCSHQECFRMIADAFSERIGAPADDLLEQLYERERLSSTLIAPGLAIPHLLLEGKNTFHLIIVRARQGVNMGAAGQPAYTLFALAGTADMRRLHLRSLSAIAQIVQDPDFERNWMEAAGPEGLRRLLLQTKRKRFNQTPTGKK